MATHLSPKDMRDRLIVTRDKHQQAEALERWWQALEANPSIPNLRDALQETMAVVLEHAFDHGKPADEGGGS